jgi:hypothetical protein
MSSLRQRIELLEADLKPYRLGLVSITICHLPPSDTSLPRNGSCAGKLGCSRRG